MEKEGVILLKKVPETCRHIRGSKENGCPFGGMTCTITGEDIMFYTEQGKKPQWCPVQPVSEFLKKKQ